MFLFNDSYKAQH
jgi:hypothetical protein